MFRPPSTAFLPGRTDSGALFRLHSSSPPTESGGLWFLLSVASEIWGIIIIRRVAVGLEKIRCCWFHHQALFDTFRYHPSTPIRQAYTICRAGLQSILPVQRSTAQLFHAAQLAARASPCLRHVNTTAMHLLHPKARRTSLAILTDFNPHCESSPSA
jgi:hypothetical protein